MPDRVGCRDAHGLVIDSLYCPISVCRLLHVKHSCMYLHSGLATTLFPPLTDRAALVSAHDGMCGNHGIMDWFMG